MKARLAWMIAAGVLALMGAQASHAFSVRPGLSLSTQPAGLGIPVALVSKLRHKKVRSCNAADNRKHHAKAAVDAWPVACEFPPRSEPNPATYQGLTAAAIAAAGG
jgi:hypothetical protein